MSTVALVVANGSDPDPGYVGERLAERGYLLRSALREDGVPATLAAAGTPALLLLLGSAWSVHDPEQPAAVAAESALVRDAVAAGVPVLGLCYGAQLVAHALGGSVARAPHAEVGLVTVDTDDAGLVAPGPWAAFHHDALTAPPGATVLARNACGVQAFSLPGVLGVQFHPEVRPAVLVGWAEAYPDVVAEAGTDVATVTAQVRDRDDPSRAAAYTLVDAFLDRVPAAS